MDVGYGDGMTTATPETISTKTKHGHTMTVTDAGPGVYPRFVASCDCGDGLQSSSGFAMEVGIRTHFDQAFLMERAASDESYLSARGTAR